MAAKRGPRKSKLRIEMEGATKLRRAAEIRVKILEDTFKHWYSIGKDQYGPCKACSLLITDPIHRDRAL